MQLNYILQAFNQTRMELKPQEERVISEKLLTFNQTRMELKPSRCPYWLLRNQAFNQTRMELKLEFHAVFIA